MYSTSKRGDMSMDHHSDDEEQSKESEPVQPVNQIDKIQRTRLQKNDMLKASIKFNLKPKNGIQYLISKDYIPKEPLE